MVQVEIMGHESRIALGSVVEVVEDPAGRLTFEQVRTEESLKWTPSRQPIPNFGYTDSAYWFRVALSNPAENEMERFLVVAYPLIDDLTLYRLENNQVQQVQTGDTRPFATRPLSNRNFVFPLKLAPKSVTYLYIRTQTEGSTQLPLDLWEPKAFHAMDEEILGSHSIYYGMMLVMVFYNLFLYLSIRESAYLYYVGFVFSFAATQAAMNGVLFQYFYPGLPQLHQFSVLLLVPLSILFTSVFSLRFLKLEQLSQRLTLIMKVSIGLALVTVAGAFVLPYGVSTRLSVALAVPICVTILVAGPYAWYKGNTSARYFVAAWVLLLIGIIMAVLNKFGVIPRNTLTEYGLQWGSALEAVLLSFALADRLNREREARLQAQRAIIDEANRREQAEERLIYQATHHGLNGFPNSSILRVCIENLFRDPAAEPFALVLVHLRRFHEINKTLGHENADQVLKLVSRRLQLCVAESPYALVMENHGNQLHRVAHIDGVTFAVLLSPASEASLGTYLPDLLELLIEPVEFDGLRIDLGIVIGAALSQTHGDDVATLMRHAQIGLDAAERKDCCYAIYARSLDSYSAKRLGLMGDLRKSLQDDELTLNFQPQVDMKQGVVTGLEALIRWNHSQHGFIPPDEFIPMAEATGLIKPLTQWVLEKAVATAVQLLESGFRLTVSVNISAVNLREPLFVKSVSDVLRRFRLPENQLVLEITESAIMADPDLALKVLKELHERGIQIAIDDFGTGQSSLSYIRKLPAQEIKMDKSFVMEMDKVTDDAVIVRTTLSMCHNLGYRMVAEGIENDDVYRLLVEMDCDFAQGYFMARPMPLPALQEWLMVSQWSAGCRKASLGSPLGNPSV